MAKNISRIDTHNTHGWFVRAYYFGLEISCFFSDKKYTNEDKALKTAQALANEWEEWTVKCRSEGIYGYEWLKEAKAIKTTYKTPR
jgi:hypothetical protein